MNYKSRRIIACIIDLLLIFILSTMISNVPYCNPYLEQYEVSLEKFNDESNTVLNNLGTGESINITNRYKKLYANLDKYSLFSVLWIIVFSLFYFVFFQYYTGGQTLGKKLFGLQVIDEDGDNVKLSQLFKRNFLIGSTLISGVFIFLLLRLVLILTNISYNIYFSIGMGISLASLIFEIVFIVKFLSSKDGRALDDIFAKTKVIDLRI